MRDVPLTLPPKVSASLPLAQAVSPTAAGHAEAAVQPASNVFDDAGIAPVIVAIEPSANVCDAGLLQDILEPAVYVDACEVEDVAACGAAEDSYRHDHDFPPDVEPVEPGTFLGCGAADPYEAVDADDESDFHGNDHNAPLVVEPVEPGALDRFLALDDQLFVGLGQLPPLPDAPETKPQKTYWEYAWLNYTRLHREELRKYVKKHPTRRQREFFQGSRAQ